CRRHRFVGEARRGPSRPPPMVSRRSDPHRRGGCGGVFGNMPSSRLWRRWSSSPTMTAFTRRGSAPSPTRSAVSARCSSSPPPPVLAEGLPPRTPLNVNVPAATPKGIRLTQLGHRVYKEKIVEQTDPRGRTHYWIGGGPPQWDRSEDTDMAALHDGYASITP